MRCDDCQAKGPDCGHGSREHAQAHWQCRRSDDLCDWLEEMATKCQVELGEKPHEHGGAHRQWLMARRDAYLEARRQADEIFEKPAETEAEIAAEKKEAPLMKWLKENWRQGKPGLVKMVMLSGEPVGKHEGRKQEPEVTIKSGGDAKDSIEGVMRMLKALAVAEKLKNASGKPAGEPDASPPSLSSLFGMFEGKEIDIGGGFWENDPEAKKKHQAVQSLLKDVYDAVHRREGPMAGSTDAELATKINDAMSSVIGNDWRGK